MKKKIAIWTSVLCALVLGIILGCDWMVSHSAEGHLEKYVRLDPPLVTLYLVPMDGMTEEKVKRLGNEFMEHFASRQGERFKVEVLPHIDTPANCLNVGKTRLRADSIIRMLSVCYKDSCRRKAADADGGRGEYHVMGVTNRDISTTVHGKPDYGILGLSYLSGPHVGVVSTHRLRDKKDLWKLTAHEFGHGFYGLPHCKNDDPHCLMADAKGGNPHFEIKDTLCIDCAAKRRIRK